ncbi:MAG: ABC transporter substrate-binding protein [Gammaproteobacteria bacterium]
MMTLMAVTLSGCDQPWNNPYPAGEEQKNILYSAFTERPKHLDPAQSYAANEAVFTAQIYEPPLQYDYLKRPYTLIPLTATQVPQAVYLDVGGQPVPSDAAASEIAYSVYDVTIKPGILYQPHPAFARDAGGKYIYHDLTAQEVKKITALADFRKTGTRELIAADYVYEIKRLAHPRLQSPILGVMNDYIVGLKEYAETLSQANAAQTQAGDNNAYLDLTRYPLEGAAVVDRYTYRIKVKGKYPQILYWLAMPFFAPVAPEVDRFYTQPGLAEKNLNLDWYPAGTGPYMLTMNNPNRQMVLERNPNFRGELYPSEGERGDIKNGLLVDAAKPMPFIDKVVYSLEKESIPYWSKFLQGYYDVSGISSDSFDQAIRIGAQGDAALSPAMQAKGIELLTAVEPSIFYLGFNMLDPVVGGYSEQARKLRLAISIAVDEEESISIFRNGRGIAAQGPIPPGISGYIEGREGINPSVYDWVNGKPQRKSIDEARRLLAEAGYPNGRDAQTGKPLLLSLDTTASGPDFKSYLDWMRRQFRKINLQLVVRDTDYNRFQDKIENGTAQMFQFGWNADYPDPENFLFLLYGPNSRVLKHGENSANYDNPEFNRLFEQMKNMENNSERQQIIDKMVAIVRHDAPWAFGLHPKQFSLNHAWYGNTKLNLMANNTLKYKRIEPELRARMRAAWNEPVVWPLLLLVAVLVLSAVPAVLTYLRREKKTAHSTPTRLIN